MKKWQTPQDVYNKDLDQTVPSKIRCLSLSSQGMFYSLDTQIFDYKTSH